jgi:hypothetical protein
MQGAAACNHLEVFASHGLTTSIIESTDNKSTPAARPRMWMVVSNILKRSIAASAVGDFSRDLISE